MEDVHLTSEGIVLGTPDYMAPEQARDARSTDIRADIYSLGCVLYHLLAGHPPFPDTNIISQMIRHATETPKPLKGFNPAVPDGLQQIVNWMLAKDPAQRYPTPARAAQALQIFLAAGAEPASAVPEADPRMNKYLTWLEIDTADDAKKAKANPAPTATLAPGAAATMAPGKPASGTLPVAAPVASMLPPDNAKPNGTRKKGRKGRKSNAGINMGKGGRHNPAASPQIDVELIALPPGATGPQKLFSLPLSRRDFFMFGVGIFTVALGAGLGFLGAWMAGAFNKKPPDSDPE
jgi:serine/threonine protein kinase